MVNLQKTRLVDELRYRSAKFCNRIVMAPMTRCRAIGNVPNDLMVTYYEQRSSAGLIITEGTAPASNGLGLARMPGIFNQQQIVAWKSITDAVHNQGAKIFIQLMHTGRIAHTANLPNEGKILAPSPINAGVDIWTDRLGTQRSEIPFEMTIADIELTIREFEQAADFAMQAGFDGVELHAGNGYLLEQFLNPHSNLRTDQYGGTVEKRIQFVVEVTKAVIHAVGKDRTGIRISPFSIYNTMPLHNETANLYQQLIKELNALDLLYVHVVTKDARSTAEGISLLQYIRKNFNNIIIQNGGYNRESANSALENKEADMISFGTSFISNPDLPKRLENNLELVKPDRKTYYTADEKGYTDYSCAL